MRSKGSIDSPDKLNQSLQKVGDIIREANENASGRVSGMTSRMASRLEVKNTMDATAEQLDSLINDDQWGNIPVPIRNTFEGLIEYCRRVGHQIGETDFFMRTEIDVLKRRTEEIQDR